MWRKKKSLSFLPPWEFQIPLSLGTPRLLINLPRNWLHFHFSLSCIGEGNGNPPQCSCLENPRDGGAWWAAVYGVAQSRTRLKRLSSSSSHRVYCIRSSSLLSIVGYLSHIQCCVYMRKEGRKQSVEYLLEMHVSVYRWEIEISVCVWKRERKEADNPCGLL